MLRYACFAVLAFTLVCRAAVAVPFCQYAAADGGEIFSDWILLNHCVAWGGAVHCLGHEYRGPDARMLVIACLPEP